MKTNTKIGIAILVMILNTTFLLGQNHHSIIENMNAKYIAALDAEDSNTIAHLYSKDAVIHNTDGSLTKGREDIRAYYQNIFDNYKLSAKVEIVDIQRLSRKHVFTTGIFELKLSVNGTDYTVLGESVSIMKKERGDWVMHKSYRHIMPKQLEKKWLKQKS